MESCASLLGSMIANVTDGILRLAINASAPATHLSVQPRSIPRTKASEAVSKPICPTLRIRAGPLICRSSNRRTAISARECRRRELLTDLRWSGAGR